MTFRSSKHWTEAELGAYVAGEVDPAVRSTVSRHLEGCAACRARLQRAERAQTLFSSAEPPPLDDLRWRRIRDQVRRQLEEDAEASAHTLDVLWGPRGWNVAAGLAAVVVVLGLGFFIRAQSTRPALPVVAEAPTSPPRSSELRLPYGVQVQLEPQTQLASKELEQEVQLILDKGQVQVEVSPTLATPPVTVRVQTERFSAKTEEASQFSVGYWADRAFVAVERGRVSVETSQASKVLEPGERWNADPKPSDRDDRPPTKVEPARSKSPPVSPKPRAAQPEAPSAPARFSSEGQTVVVVEAPPLDAVAQMWHEANQAYYTDRDVDRAIELAGRVRASGRDRPEYYPAAELLCDAYVTRRRPHAAVKACLALLEEARRVEAVHVMHSIHYRLANTYRTQLNDCTSAIQHYDRIITFGQATRFDDDARLFRATCALEVGDLNLANRDISTLQGRIRHLARPNELRALQRRLEAARSKTP